VGDAVHSLDWGQYGDLQRGDYDKARLWMDRLADMVDNEGFATTGGARGAAGIARAQGAVSLLKARYIVETEQWETQPITEDSRAHELLATGLSAHRLGDQAIVTEAEAALKELSDGEGYTHVMHKQVGALRHAAMGHPDVAIGLMDEAEAEVMSMAPPRGSASPVKPLHELYGELLLELGMPDKAVEKFETSLLRMPNRPRSLLGLARAHAANGDAVLAAEAYAKVADLWSGLAHAGLMEAEAFLNEAESEGNQGNR